MNGTFRLGLALALCTSHVAARAERPPDDRDTVPSVFSGRVEAVEERWDLECDHHRVSIRVDAMERGRDPAPGERVVVGCYRRSRPWPGYVGDGGHGSVPGVGERIRVFALPDRTDYVGCYPDWYDVVEPSAVSPTARPFGYRKFRTIGSVALVGMVLFAVWRLRMGRRRGTSSRIATATPAEL